MTIPEAVYPIRCIPVLKSKIWGGRKLEKLYGMPLPAGEQVGEAWMAADLPEGSSTVGNGPREGQTLSEATAAWGEAMIGTAWQGRPTGKRFPLLIKLLDAQDDLSVQVHPDDAACREHFPGDFSKDESWIVVHSDTGGRILHGFEAGTTLADFDRLLSEGRVTECLRSVEVKRGNIFRVKPGTVHALCRGVAILEIQEPSDTTFRIFDYNRPGDDGKPRALHIEQARRVMRFGDETPPRATPVRSDRSWGTHELCIDAPAYRIERAEAAGDLSWRVNPASVQVLVVLSGSGDLRAAGETLELKPGDCVILPAAVGEARLRPAADGLRIVLSGAGGVDMLGMAK